MSELSLKSMEPLIDARVRLTIQKMQEEMKTRGVADVYKWWFFMATDIIGEITFGESFRMLEKGKVGDSLLRPDAVYLMHCRKTNM